MARPRLDEEERRTRTVGVRVTAAEATELRERAQAARLSMGAYLRRRAQGERVVDGRGHSGGRWRRERMNPQQEREAIPAGRDGWGEPERERGKALGELEKRSKREWSALYGRHQRQREQLGKDCRGVLGRFRLWRELGGGVREIGGAVRGRPEVLEGFRAELEHRLRWERVSLGKAHSEAVREIDGEQAGAEGAGAGLWPQPLGLSLAAEQLKSTISASSRHLSL